MKVGARYLKGHPAVAAGDEADGELVFDEATGALAFGLLVRVSSSPTDLRRTPSERFRLDAGALDA